MAILDASLQVALVNTADPHHAAATAWYRAALLADEPIHAPWILVPEVAAALSRGLGDDILARRVAQRLAEGGLVDLITVDAPLATAAADVAARHRVRGCDAVYVALAADLGEPLVTLDRQQRGRAARVVTVVVPGMGG